MTKPDNSRTGIPVMPGISLLATNAGAFWLEEDILYLTNHRGSHEWWRGVDLPEATWRVVKNFLDYARAPL